jgi:hypothetical protein
LYSDRIKIKPQIVAPEPDKHTDFERQQIVHSRTSNA